MRHAQWLAVGGMALMGILAACSDDLAGASRYSADCADGRDCSSKPSAGADAGDGSNTSDGKGPAGVPGAPTSDGVLILHAAIFPSFRLCFEKDLDRVPQPDSAVMPEANVVGVEQGSIVRIDPLTKEPGRVIVVREKDLRNKTDKKCSDLFTVDAGKIKPVNQDDFTGTSSFLVTNAIAQPVGVAQAELLVISGCGTQPTLDLLDQVDIDQASNARCGTGWKASTGNLTATPLALQASYATPTDEKIPAQLINVAPAIEALKGTTTVSFGETGKAGRDLSLAPTFQAGEQLELDVKQNELTSYATLGFDVSVKLPAETVTATQTLADVQSLSAPSETPSHYYRSASNYALLLLGDPTHKPTLAGGGTNPAYNPRRALHILAVPVLDPTKQDAGAPDGGLDIDSGTP